MDWEKLHEEVYYEDEGTWRDIYVLNTSRQDWLQWIDYVNSNYEVLFNETTTGIDKKIIVHNWDNDTNQSDFAIIKVGSVPCKCLFSCDTDIEVYLDPQDVKTIEDHNAILQYMVGISSLLNKTVELTPENSRGFAHITVDKIDVKFGFD